ncbi:MAG: hypothetical protein IJ198_11725 [Lachnospiraceae bacterium]|nr:hypothetical protein [Lachnospiraceae bacterium]
MYLYISVPYRTYICKHMFCFAVRVFARTGKTTSTDRIHLAVYRGGSLLRKHDKKAREMAASPGLFLRAAMAISQSAQITLTV